MYLNCGLKKNEGVRDPRAYAHNFIDSENKTCKNIRLGRLLFTYLLICSFVTSSSSIKHAKGEQEHPQLGSQNNKSLFQLQLNVASILSCFHIFVSFPTVQSHHIGCYADKAAAAIPSLEGEDPLLDGDAETREDAKQKCARVTIKRGFAYFALQDGGYCHSSLSAQDTYNKYGLSTDCKLGKGGKMAIDVYEVIMFSK